MKLDHVAIAVINLDEAAARFGVGGLGLSRKKTLVVESQKVRVSIFEAAGVKVELMEPSGPDSPISAFLEKRGEGLHHVCFEVEDLDAKLEELSAAGAGLINRTPAAGAGGRRVAFVHPKSFSGVLIELVEAAGNEPGHQDHL